MKLKMITKIKRADIKEIRRLQLIYATLDIIEKVGLANASIVLIAAQANLSTGIISHYFGDKNGLLVAVMQHIMQELNNRMREERQKLDVIGDDSPLSRIKLVIDSNLSENQTTGPIMKTWLAFWASSMHQDSLARLNKINENRLYSNLYYQFSRCLPKDQAHLATLGLSALIEGLWLRVALTESAFDLKTSRIVAYQYLQQFDLDKSRFPK